MAAVWTRTAFAQQAAAAAVQSDEAAAAEEEGFGRYGSIVLSSAEAVRAQSTSYSSGDSRVGVTVAPSLDFFAAPHVSIGAEVLYSYDAVHVEAPGAAAYDTSRSFLGFAARAGADFAVSRLVSIWPRLGFGFSLNRVTTTNPQGGDGTDSGRFFTLEAPILLHPSMHFFVGVGPSFYTELGRTLTPGRSLPNRTTLSASLFVGGWL